MGHLRDICRPTPNGTDVSNTHVSTVLRKKASCCHSHHEHHSTQSFNQELDLMLHCGGDRL